MSDVFDYIKEMLKAAVIGAVFIVTVFVVAIMLAAVIKFTGLGNAVAPSSKATRHEVERFNAEANERFIKIESRLDAMEKERQQ